MVSADVDAVGFLFCRYALPLCQLRDALRNMNSAIRNLDAVQQQAVRASPKRCINQPPPRGISNVCVSISDAMARNSQRGVRPLPLDALLLPVRSDSRSVWRGTTASNATIILLPRMKPLSQRHQWHQQIWGVSPGYRQNESLLEAVRAAEKRPNGVAIYMPRGICLDPDGKQAFVVRPCHGSSPSHEHRVRPVTQPQMAPPHGSSGLASSAERQRNLRKWYEKAK